MLSLSKHEDRYGTPPESPAIRRIITQVPALCRLLSGAFKSQNPQEMQRECGP